MNRVRTAAGLALALVLATSFAPRASAQAVRSEIEGIVHDYLAQHPEEVAAIVGDYFVKHPEVLQQVLLDAIKKRAATASSSQAGATAGTGRPGAAEAAVAIRSHAAELFSSPRQVTLGAADGDVTLVEFFDYNCGYCKRALGDTLALMKDDPKLKIVLKEYPILSPGSAEAARIGVALRMQDPDGSKYLAFHEKLLTSRGAANRAAALAAAAEAGADMTRLESDVASDEVTKTLAENRELAKALGVSGTPGYVVGELVVPGAVGADALKKAIARARN